MVNIGTEPDMKNAFGNAKNQANKTQKLQWANNDSWMTGCKTEWTQRPITPK